jgi:hypothetical protein
MYQDVLFTLNMLNVSVTDSKPVKFQPNKLYLSNNKDRRMTV